MLCWRWRWGSERERGGFDCTEGCKTGDLTSGQCRFSGCCIPRQRTLVVAEDTCREKRTHGDKGEIKSMRASWTLSYIN